MQVIMQIHCFTDTFLIDYSSTLTNVLIRGLKKMFRSVSSFVMIVFCLAKQVST